MIRTVAMMIGGMLLLLVACPLHALAKAGGGHQNQHTRESGAFPHATEPVSPLDP